MPVQPPSMGFFKYHDFSVPDGFVEGTNTLEFDVYNGGNAYPSTTGISPMALRVELDMVSVPRLKSYKTNSDKATLEKPGKEAAQ